MKFWRWKWAYLLWLAVTDAALVYFSYWLAYRIRFDFAPFLAVFPANKGIPPWNLYAEALRAVVPVWLLIFAFWGHLYSKHFVPATDEFLSILKGVTLSSIFIIAGTFLYRRYEYSRLVIALSWFLALFSIFTCRELWKQIARMLYNHLGGQDNVILIADGKVAETVSKLIRRDPHHNLITVKPEEIDPIRTQMLSGMIVREVIVQGQSLANAKIEDFLEECEDSGIDIKILPDFLEMRLGEILVDESLGIPVLHLKPLSLQGFRYYFKRVFDITLAILILSVFSIPLAILSLCIAVDSPGGVFFLQDRMGFKEKIFKCLKFRTMHRNAETLLKEMNLPSFRGGPAFKMKGDPRVTRVGKWVRKFSMDELPQIWNILRGEMSFIGPRPQVMAEANGNPDWAKKRYRILPGITGLWQVSGRADLSYEDMMRLDIYYLENWSPGLDLRILLKTLPVVLGAKGAY